MKITVGTDPEVCVVDAGGEIVPSGAVFDWLEQHGDVVIQPPPPQEGMPPKGRKYAIPNLSSFYIYEDGASLEFNLPPALNAMEMTCNLRGLLLAANRIVQDSGYQMVIKASLPITDEVIKRGGIALSRFGCDPDKTLWNDPYDPSLIDATACYRRYYGGHIHMGVPEGQDVEVYYDREWEMSVTCDLILGLADVMIDHSPEAVARRQVYGRIGRHRNQVYAFEVNGFEYRTPSNGWLCSPKTTYLMFSLAQVAAYVATTPELYSSLVEGVSLDTLKQAINETNFDLAEQLFNNHVSNFIAHLMMTDEYVQNEIDLNMDALDDAVFNPHTDWFSNWS